MMRFSSNQRLRRGADFKHQSQEGVKSQFGGYICRIQKPPISEGNSFKRLGIIASKRVGNAVKRNRAKRIFREIFRLNQEQLPPECDVVIIVRNQFGNFSFTELQGQFLKACQSYRRKTERA